ncbi:MAG TPA: M56 family metallopeptidase [Thermodesulfovibrionales bacterium]|nr:M56 family metallopeptidase [Thermodesulfovibrionales bacterium]
MDIANFLNTYPGMYLAQSVFHSFIAAVVVDRAFVIWRIKDPLVKQRFRLIVVLVPVFSFPLYQVLNPDRGSLSFRAEAIFNINGWLTPTLWGTISAGFLFFGLLLITTAIFLFQELIPVVRHTFESKGPDPDMEEAGEHSVVGQALRGLSGERPGVYVIDDEEFILFSTTGKNAAIFLSTELVSALTVDEMQAAIAHELAHIMRNKRPFLVVVFFLRILMFFNPVVLLEFRRIVQEEEKICDDMAVALTQNPHALSETLKKLYYKGKALQLVQFQDITRLRESLEEFSHNIHIESRILRLEEGPGEREGKAWLQLTLTLVVIITINYFIV